MGRACVVWVDPRGGVAYGHVGMSLYGPTRLLDTCSTSHQHVALLVVTCMYCACRVHRVHTIAGYGQPAATLSHEAIKRSCAILRLMFACGTPHARQYSLATRMGSRLMAKCLLSLTMTLSCFRGDWIAGRTQRRQCLRSSRGPRAITWPGSRGNASRFSPRE